MKKYYVPVISVYNEEKTTRIDAVQQGGNTSKKEALKDVNKLRNRITKGDFDYLKKQGKVVAELEIHNDATYELLEIEES
jgi:hypothetical protein